ncbi:MAG: hypothetical protein XU13_C0033G0021 [Candidatus Rokubacteria bacterium CSP1-6]|nr:MAG: hypothetical protein XU13_C0033G0021 [Candidatus Rokubacteria bacterium CSP1-6]
MRREPWTKGWGAKGAVIAAVLLTMMVGCCMVGFCTFSHVSDGFDGHGVSLDLCAAMLVASVTLALLAGPLVNSWLLVDPARFVYVVSLHRPDPPPKSLSHF